MGLRVANLPFTAGAGGVVRQARPEAPAVPAGLLGRLAVGRLLAAPLLLASCARLFDLPDDPVVAPGGPWGCLSQARLALSPARVEPLDADARITVYACDFIANCTQPVTQLSGKLCDRRDVGCQRPREEGLTDEEGVFSLEVPTSGEGFDGYLQAPMSPDSSSASTESRLIPLPSSSRFINGISGDESA